MRRKKGYTVLLSALCLFTLLAGCVKQASPSTSDDPVESSAVVEDGRVRLALYRGSGAMGAVKLIADSDAGETVNLYTITMTTDPTDGTVEEGLLSGALDLASLPTNRAATLYEESGGEIQMVAIDTLGMLTILEQGNTVYSLGDLRGKTLFAAGQGTSAEYVLAYLLRLNGLTPGSDVTIEWRSAEELTRLAAAGDVELCMLPMPEAATVMAQNPELRQSVDLSQAWNEADVDAPMTLGCVVVRTAFAKENPAAVKTFLEEYGACVSYVNDDPEEAAALMAAYGLTPTAEVALAAIPQAGITWITGVDMVEIQNFFEILYLENPDAIGGTIPDDAFFYIAR